MAQALGYAVSEEMVYDAGRSARERDFVDYHIFRADEMPVKSTTLLKPMNHRIRLGRGCG